MTTALEHRLAELDREIVKARVEYDHALKRTTSEDYSGGMLAALARIADLLTTAPADGVDSWALMTVGRIQEIVEPFKLVQASIDRYLALREQRARLEGKAA